jgi:hypothetical protein
MTQLLEHAVDIVRGLPPETQDDLARVPCNSPERINR